MSGKTTAGNLEECNLADRIPLTLHLADRRGYGMSLAHLSKMLIYGEAEEEKVRIMLSSMPSVSHQDGIYCLKKSESLLFETRGRLLCNRMIGERYETQAMLFASEYASLCPFHLIYTNYVVSKLGERICKGTSAFLGGLYSSHAGITSKPFLCEGGD